MMASIDIFVFFCAAVVITGAQTPKKCCVVSNWQSAMTNTSLFNEEQMQYSQYYVDYDMKMDVIQHFKLKPHNPGTPIYRLVNDYKKGKTYYIPAEGKCLPLPNKRKMSPPCIPDDATFLGSSYVGLSNQGVPYDGWRFKHDVYTITIGLATNSCVPIVEGVKGPNIDVAYFFNQFETPIKDRSVFEVPASCGK